MPYPISPPVAKPKYYMPYRVVAASDASDESKAKAHYVCDGTNDFLDIEHAINDLPSQGGIVFLTEGTFNLGSQSVDITKSNVTIIGSGSATILTAGSNYCFYANGLSNIRIKNLAIKDTYGGIQLLNVSNCVIENCYFENMTDQPAISITGASSNIVTNNIIKSVVVIECGVFTGNILDGNGAATLINGSGLLVSNNVFKNTTIFFGASNSRFINNIILQAPQDGLYIVESNNLIFGNYVEASSQSANGSYDNIRVVYADNNFILFNIVKAGTLTNKPGYGIYITGSGNVVLYNDISGDYVSGKFKDSGTNTVTSPVDRFVGMLDLIAIDKGNASSTTVTETTETLKQSVSPDKTYIYYLEGVHVIANNPSGSGVTLYFKVKAELDDGSEVELSSESVAEGNSFDSWLRWVYDTVTNQKKIKTIKLYAYCSDTPVSGSEPTVQLERVTGVQG